MHEPNPLEADEPQDFFAFLAAGEWTQLGIWDPDYQVNYSDIDAELRELVRLLNRVDGMITRDSCFGHPDDPNKHQNQQPDAFMGLMVSDANKFFAFWRFVLSYTHGQFGKIYIAEDNSSGFVIGLHMQMFPGPQQVMVRLMITPFNLNLSRQEKLAGIWLLSRLTEAYVEGRNPSPGDLGIDNLLLTLEDTSEG